MASSPNDYANPSTFEELQNMLLENSKDVKFIFKLNGDNNTDDGPSAAKNARYDAGSSRSSNDIVKISAHKCLLAASSPVFNAMFNGPLKEAGDVPIVDVSPDAFREFLQFFYSNQDTCLLTMENLGEVMQLVDKYDVKDGWPIVDAFFKRSLTVDDILWGLHLAVKFRRDNLITHCRNTIEQNVVSVYDMIEFDDSGKPKLRSNPNNRPMTDADLAKIFSRVYTSFKKCASGPTPPISIEFEIGEFDTYFIDTPKDISFSSGRTLLLTHIEYPGLFHGDDNGRRVKYDIEVSIAGTETRYEVPYHGGTVKLMDPVLVEPHRTYTIQTKVITEFKHDRHYFGSITPSEPIEVVPGISISFESAESISFVAGMTFSQYDQ